MRWITSALSTVLSPIAQLFQAREQRQQHQSIAKAKIAEAKLKGQHEVTLSDAEWEAITPIVLLLLGSLWLAFTGDARLLNGVNQGIKALQTLGVPMGLLMEAVVFAAIGLKLWRSR